jgi:hypothetical protein
MMSFLPLVYATLLQSLICSLCLRPSSRSLCKSISGCVFYLMDTCCIFFMLQGWSVLDMTTGSSLFFSTVFGVFVPLISNFLYILVYLFFFFCNIHRPHLYAPPPFASASDGTLKASYSSLSSKKPGDDKLHTFGSHSSSRAGSKFHGRLIWWFINSAPVFKRIHD